MQPHCTPPATASPGPNAGSRTVLETPASRAIRARGLINHYVLVQIPEGAGEDAGTQHRLREFPSRVCDCLEGYDDVIFSDHILVLHDHSAAGVALAESVVSSAKREWASFSAELPPPRAAEELARSPGESDLELFERCAEFLLAQEQAGGRAIVIVASTDVCKALRYLGRPAESDTRHFRDLPPLEAYTFEELSGRSFAL